MKELVLKMCKARGALLHPEAANYLLSKDDPVTVTKLLLNKFEACPLVITLEDILKAEEIARTAAGKELMRERLTLPQKELPKTNLLIDKIRAAVPEEEVMPAMRGRLRTHKAIAKDYSADVKIIKDVTGNSKSEGSIEDFNEYFEDRFKTIKKMIRARVEMSNLVSILHAKRLSGQVKIIGMVNEVKTTKTGHKIVELEDEEGSCSVFFSKDGLLIENAVVPDEVIGIVGTMSKKGDLLIAQNLIRPDIPPMRNPKLSEEPMSVAFVSDIHVGSATFLTEQWNKFTKWLHSKENGGKAERIKYLVIPGDVVDGIGVYPEQEDELNIDDIYSQYEELARLIEDLPDHIKIIMMPGNHDAVRPAEPQPTFPSEITKLFNSDIMFVGNPCQFTLNRVNILAYHGRSMDDYISHIQKMHYNKPIEIMKEMLKRRHLAPVYGDKTPIAPEHKDYLVIDNVPDIFVTGHVHWTSVENYRGVILINASAWQSQTSYQRMRNFYPDPAKVPIVDLDTGKWTVMSFN